MAGEGSLNKYRLADVDRKLAAARERVRSARRESVSPSDVAAALAGFDPLWETLAPRERHRVLRLLVETATYDGTAGTLTVRFRAVGLQTLARERAEHP